MIRQKPIWKTAVLLSFYLVSPITHSKQLNGFDLTNALIPVEEILQGGPPKDGIPALDKPKYVNSKDAKELKPDDEVMGVVINNIARAYPIRIMNWHELVNDIIAGKNIAVTYCPLCGSGMVFDATIDGQHLYFGVSGLLYISDVLLYDRKTESLWSQLKTQAVTGSFRGKKLKAIPVQHTTWSQWQTQYPNTKVVSFDTGYSRNYSRNPYAGYAKTSQLYFPLKFRSLGIHPKERVIAIEINGEEKAWPFIELQHSKKMIKDTLGKQTVYIDYNLKSNSARILDDNKQLLPATTLFWFAWSAFHPETKVYKYIKK